MHSDSEPEDVNSPIDSDSDPLDQLHPKLLSALKPLDISDHVVIKGAKVVHTGAHGDTYRAFYQPPSGERLRVAIKLLRFHTGHVITDLFEKDIYVWSKLKHANILPLLGYAFDDRTGFPMLVSEWMRNGSAWHYVQKNPNCDLMRLIIGAAEGISYLHNLGVVHSKIEPGNILVSNTGDALICSFEGSRIKPISRIQGSVAYVAYELLAEPDKCNSHTQKTDVWSFGMTAFALISQEHPYKLLSGIQVARAIMNRELPSFNFYTTRSDEEKNILRNICNLCWDHDPRHRDSMAYIAEILRDFMIKRELSSKLDMYAKCISTSSEGYQYFLAAKKLILSLQWEDLKAEKELGHLIRTIRVVLNLAMSSSFGSPNQWENTIRLLQQTIECCLFTKQYLSSEFKEHIFSQRKITEFVSFFVSFKNLLDTGAGVLPVFISSRVSNDINNSILQQRFSPRDFDNSNQQKCLTGTRVTVQERIITWLLSGSSQNILWLQGASGSGKSAVAASVAEYFRAINRLGAYIDFKRGSSDPSSAISTIAFKLALSDFTIGSLILAKTDEGKNSDNTHVRTQFERLLLEPLVASAGAQYGPVAIIIDALDACGTPSTRETFTQEFLHELPRLPSTFRFLITSRQERDIAKTLLLQSESVTLLELDYSSEDSRRDIQLYLNHEMRKIVEDDMDELEEESMMENISHIENTVAGRFDWASKFVNLVSEHDKPLQKLEEMVHANLFKTLNLLQVIRDDVLDALCHFDLSERVSLERKTLIGTGAFSDVFRVYIPPRDGKKKSYVAAKQLRFYKDAQDMINLFENEIYVWSKLDHPNVLPLLGFVINEENGYPLLITDWMNKGSAGKYVRAKDDCDLMRLVAGVATGLAYLHEMNVTHSDLKPENILISSTGDALICDFGAARIFAASKELKSFGTIGTLHYMACELLADGGESIAYSPPTDVWAFGMTVFELLARELPYHQYMIEAQVTMAIREKKLPTLPETSSWSDQRLEAKKVLWDIMQSCWEFIPSDRPDMVTIKDKIHKHMESRSI